jgi:ribosome-binding factor A
LKRHLQPEHLGTKMVSKTRLIRISERMREELSEIILMVSSDPRLKGISITGVEVDRELAYADIYVCALEGSQRSQEVLAGLEHAQGFLRSELAHRMDLRLFPRLRFHWDPTFEHADTIERVLIRIHETDSEKMLAVKKKRVEKHDTTKS